MGKIVFKMEGRRIFAAIEISGQARRAVSDYIADLKREFRNLRVGWVSPEKLHITLKFAGNIGNEELAEMTASAQTAGASIQPFSVTVAETGAFIKPGGSNVLWLGLNASQIVDAAATFDPDITQRKQTFTPHLTIARLREPQNSKALIDHHLAAKFEPIEFTAQELVIFESKLLAHGSVYTAVSRHKFNK
jgi:RNA 2',3'-cyclic 3'-phosphodiesterase